MFFPLYYNLGTTSLSRLENWETPEARTIRLGRRRSGHTRVFDISAATMCPKTTGFTGSSSSTLAILQLYYTQFLRCTQIFDHWQFYASVLVCWRFWKIWELTSSGSRVFWESLEKIDIVLHSAWSTSVFPAFWHSSTDIATSTLRRGGINGTTCNSWHLSAVTKTIVGQTVDSCWITMLTYSVDLLCWFSILIYYVDSCWYKYICICIYVYVYIYLYI